MQIEESRKLQLEIGRGIQEQLEVRENFHFQWFKFSKFSNFPNLLLSFYFSVFQLQRNLQMLVQEQKKQVNDAK